MGKIPVECGPCHHQGVHKDLTNNIRNQIKTEYFETFLMAGPVFLGHAIYCLWHISYLLGLYFTFLMQGVRLFGAKNVLIWQESSLLSL